MSGEELAKNIIQEFSTQDIFMLCEKADIVLRYESWYPVTLGEFDRKTKKICINLNAKIDQKQIIAHELGHYFIHRNGLKLSKIEEEIMAEAFAKTLLFY